MISIHPIFPLRGMKRSLCGGWGKECPWKNETPLSKRITHGHLVFNIRISVQYQNLCLSVFFRKVPGFVRQTKDSCPAEFLTRLACITQEKYMNDAPVFSYVRL